MLMLGRSAGSTKRVPTMTVLVTYASKHGATEGIARAVADRLRERGIEAEARPAHEVRDIDGFTAAVIGSAVYAGSWMREAMSFVHAYGADLAKLPVWLFSSGPLGTEVHDDEEQPKQLDELRETLSPEGHQVFFGALDMGALSFSERMIVKAVKAPVGDFRDWKAIREWVDDIALELGG
jgi:menaquinone-dependent protoporphyrinogen oxidase